MLIERFATLAEAMGRPWGHGVTELLAGELERSPAWLAAEEGRISPTQHYLVVHDEGRVLAMAFCYPVPHGAVHRAYAARELLLGAPVGDLLARLPVGPTRQVAEQELAALRERLPAKATDTLAVVTPGSVFPGVVSSARLTIPARRRALRLLVDAVQRLAEELELPIVEFVHVRDEAADRELHGVLRESEFAAAVVGADAVLQARFADLEEYFASFRANRRKVLRKEHARFAEQRPVVRLQGPEGLTEDLLELQLARYRHYGHQSDAAAVRDRFNRAAAIPGLKVLRADGASGLLGFVAFYEHRRSGRLVPRFGAFARDRSGSYFSLAYYELIAHAARLGGMRIHYGDSTYPAKTSRGCRLTTLTSYLWTPDPTLHELLRDGARLRTALEERELAAAAPREPGGPGVSVLFDAAGTLFELDPQLPVLLSRLATEAGGTTSAEELDRAIDLVGGTAGWPDDQATPAARVHAWSAFLKQVLAAASIDWPTGVDDPCSTVADRATAVVLDPDRYRVFPEVPAVLARLGAAGIPVGIVSNFDDFLFDILRATELDSQFRVVVSSFHAGVCKPDPAIFQPALDALRSDRDSSYFVGDSVYSDMGGARRAGLQGVLIDREGAQSGYQGTKIGSLLELTSLLGL